MIKKQTIHVLLLGAILCILTLSLPVGANAQDNSLCGYFQDDGYYFYTFYPYNGYEPLPSPYSAEDFETTFGFPIEAGIVWVELYNPWFNRSGVLTGFDSFSIVDSCAPWNYTEPTATLEPVLEFYADSTTIYAGECTTLYWYANETYEQVFLDSDYGEVLGIGEGHAPPSGSATVCPFTDTSYRLTGAYGITQDHSDITIYVIQPTSTSVPPTATRLPTRTPVPATSTSIPSSTAISTLIVPSPRPISTLVVPPPANETSTLELNVVTVNQHLSPAVTLSNGLVDNGEYNCFVASMSMALEYFKSQNALDENDTTSYRDLVPIVRGTTPPGSTLSSDPAFTSAVTHNKLSARPFYTTSENLSSVIETEIRAGRPVVSGVPNWHLLAANWSGVVAHSIFIYGLHDERVYYVDPWDGKRYDMPVEDFARANSWKDGSFLITFSNTQQ